MIQNNMGTGGGDESVHSCAFPVKQDTIPISSSRGELKLQFKQQHCTEDILICADSNCSFKFSHHIFHTKAFDIFP